MATVSSGMTDQRRALLTEREREILTQEADVTDNYRYSVESRIRSRIRDRLAADVDVIRTNYPEMFDELIYPLVCEPGGEMDSAAADDVEEPGEVEPVVESTPTPDHTRDAGTDDVDLKEIVTAFDDDDRERVAAFVDDVSSSWRDSEDRLAARRAAARAVLEHAVATGDAVGKSDAIDGFYADHPVDGQNDETWWRKNIRPVLKAAGSYSQGQHGYVVDDLGGDGE